MVCRVINARPAPVGSRHASVTSSGAGKAMRSDSMPRLFFAQMGEAASCHTYNICTVAATALASYLIVSSCLESDATPNERVRDRACGARRVKLEGEMPGNEIGNRCGRSL